MAAGVPPQQQHFQQQQHSQQRQLQQQQQQLSMPAGSINHMAGSHHSQPSTSQDWLPMPTGSVGLPQPAMAGAEAASVTADGTSMQPAADHQYMQPEMLRDVSSQQQQQQGVQLSVVEAQGGFQCGYPQQQHDQSQHQQVWQQQQQQMSMQPLAHQLCHQQPLLQTVGQQMQHGQSMPASKAQTPWVQHAWYPALPGGYQPPLNAPFIAPENMQHKLQQPHWCPAVSKTQYAISYVPVSQYGTSQADMLSWTGHDGYSTAINVSEAANTEIPSLSYNRSPKKESNQLQQPQQRADNKQLLQSKSSALSPSTKVQKGVIKTYNLNALLS